MFFLHKGQRLKLSSKQLKSFLEYKTGIPLITYIQSVKEDYSKFLTFCASYSRDGFKSAFVPSSSNPEILDKARELCKYLIGVIENHEKKKVVLIQIEFMVDNHSILWLSYMDSCQTVCEEEFALYSLNIVKKITIDRKSNELLEIINELDSPKRVAQRNPTLIRKLDSLKNSTPIRIDSPEYSFESGAENDEEGVTFSKAALNILKKEDKSKLNKNFLELISKTRVVMNNPNSKLLITDEEFKSEYKKLTKMFNNYQNPSQEIKDWPRKKIHDGSLGNTANLVKSANNQSNSLELLKKLSKPEKYSKWKPYIPVLSTKNQTNALSKNIKPSSSNRIISAYSTRINSPAL